MFSNETIRKLREIHMGVMAEQLSAQLEDPQFRNVPFEDRLAMPVDAEWSARKSNRLTGLIKKAGYADTQASVKNIEYIAERHLDREQILRLASCSYIQEARNVIILGATGAGKTFLACSLGVAANRNFYAARYLRLPDLLLNDAVTIPEMTIMQVPIIKGDAKSVSIAAASILAKVTRDRLMIEYDKILPEYGFAGHKGYGSKEHIAAIQKYGPSPIHRRTFIKNFM